ncbi:hypothetical protein WKK05_05730 [Nostoc sp. UHCC 0302]|uniref:hypothetical protein n=1 Tax=Nostoc sp. UHCC 0302 TaxID=3134896 RepID=UPI00311CCB3A
MTSAYHLIFCQETYKDLGVDYFDKQQPESVNKELIKRLDNFGYQVSFEPITVVI